MIEAHKRNLARHVLEEVRKQRPEGAAAELKHFSEPLRDKHGQSRQYDWLVVTATSVTVIKVSPSGSAMA